MLQNSMFRKRKRRDSDCLQRLLQDSDDTVPQQTSLIKTVVCGEAREACDWLLAGLLS